jgi:hypothetical protein
MAYSEIPRDSMIDNDGVIDWHDLLLSMCIFVRRQAGTQRRTTSQVQSGEVV